MIHSHRLANGQKFHDVDPALTTLIFGHKRFEAYEDDQPARAELNLRLCVHETNSIHKRRSR